MQSSLQQFGLSEREASVYYASLTLGKSTVEQIAREAGIIRTTTYTQIDSLLKRGLMSSFTEGKKTYYTAEDPSNLSRLIEQQKKTATENESLLTSLLPDLTALYSKSGSKPVVRFFPGKEGLITMRNEVLQMTGKELLVATALDDFNKVFSTPEERQIFSRKRQKLNIKTRMLFTTTDLKKPNKYTPETYRQVSGEEFPFEFDIYIFDNKIALSSLKDDVWGVMIESNAVAKSMKTLFEMSWQLAEKK